MLPPPPPLLLGAEARSIQLFSSCAGVRATGGFFGRGADRCATGWRAWGFLADAASAQAHGAMTANTTAIAVDRTMRTSTGSGAIGRSRPQLRGGARVLGRAFDLA